MDWLVQAELTHAHLIDKIGCGRLCGGQRPRKGGPRCGLSRHSALAEPQPYASVLLEPEVWGAVVRCRRRRRRGGSQVRTREPRHRAERGRLRYLLGAIVGGSCISVRTVLDPDRDTREAYCHVGKCEGSRMPAIDVLAWRWGRRPKASREGTRGMGARGSGAMGICRLCFVRFGRTDADGGWR